MNLARAFSYTRQLEEGQAQLLEELEAHETEAGRSAAQTALHCMRLTEERAREVSALERRIAEQRADHFVERDALYAEIRSLRHQIIELLDRVTEKLKLVPMSEPMKAEPPTREEAAARSAKIDSARRTGPVAKSQQEAEDAYFAEKEKQEAATRRPAV